MGRLVRAMAAAGAAAALIGATAEPEPITVRSDGGHFVLRIVGIGRPERLNHMHGFDLWLATASGQPVTGASIVLTGERLYASNPLPTLPQVTAAAGDGHYRVEGLRFHMLGQWRLAFDIRLAQSHDRATVAVEVR